MINSNENVASLHFRCFLGTAVMICKLSFSTTFMRDFSLQAFLFDNVLSPISFGKFSGSQLDLVFFETSGVTLEFDKNAESYFLTFANAFHQILDNGLKCKFYKIKDLEIGFGLKCDVFIAECAMKITMYNKYLMVLTQKGYDKDLTSKRPDLTKLISLQYGPWFCQNMLT